MVSGKMGSTISFVLLLFLERGLKVDSFRAEAAGLPNVEEDLFSQETLLQHKAFHDDGDQQEYFKFDCKNKAEGTYVEESTDCTLYHICENSTRIGGHPKLTTLLCPPGTRFHIESSKCVWWDDVICSDGYSPLKSTSSGTFKNQQVGQFWKEIVRGRSAKKSKRNLRRLEHRNNLLRNDFALPKEAFETRNVESYVDTELKSRQSLYDQQPPYECYWCCKPQHNSRDQYCNTFSALLTTTPVIVPATPRPVTSDPFSWAPYPVTNRPIAVWKPEATSTTTTRRPPFDSFSWIPTQTQNWWTPKPVQSTQPPTGTNTTNHFAVTDDVPLSQIQILEVRQQGNQNQNVAESKDGSDCHDRSETSVSAENDFA